MRILPLRIAATLLLSVCHLHAASVLEFGAKGDGTTDDTAAVQRAADTGTVFFPKGSYRISSTILLDLQKTGPASVSADGTATILMTGAGPAFRFTGTHTGSADPKSFKAEVWEKERSPRVTGLEIVGENPEADGIEASGTMQLTVFGVVIRKVRHGIHLVVRNRNVLITGCHIFENSGCGVFLDHVNLHQTNIVGSHISYNRGGGVVTRGGEVRNVQIGTCDIESNMGPDVPPTANVLIDCTDGSTDEVAITGCTLQHNSKSPGSANIRFIGRGITSTKDASPTQEGNIAITGNVFSDVMVNIHLQNVRGATITGNTFWEGFEHDLLLEHCDSVVVGANNFDRNPRYVVNGNWGKERNGLLLRDCSDVKLDGLSIKGVWQKPAAVQLENCTRATVQNCSVLDSDGVLLSLKNCKQTSVTGCVLRDDRPEKKATLSISVEGGGDNWIAGNWIPLGANGLSDSELTQNRR